LYQYLFLETMKNLFLAFSCIMCLSSQAQNLLSWTPKFLKETNSSNPVIILDASKGNQGLLNFANTSGVWLHMGCITNKSTGPSGWKYVKTTWPATTPGFNATYLGNNKYSFTINNSNLRTYFNITDPTEKIVKISLLFRDANGTVVQRNSDASDMYIPVDTTNNTLVRFVEPPAEPRYIPWAEPITAAVGQALPTKVYTSKNATINLFLNGTNIGTASAIDSLAASPVLLQGCNNQLVATASDGITTGTDTLNFFVNGGIGSFVPLPAGVEDGINYTSNTSVTLVLLAPKKNSVVLLGSMNNWLPSCNYIMNRTPDSLRHWITLTGLTAGNTYKFQYLVDGVINTTDPYCELILDPWNDANITAATYPGMPTYPTGQSGIVGTFTPGLSPYNWTTTNYVRPNKKGIVVYELLLRDFVKTHDWKTLKDTLGYLKNLGINCIEVMPFNEFEGNESWGYNPDFYFAPDKYYGSAIDLKKFVDAAHSMGIAVILDATLNHVTGLSPMAKMYWNSSTNKPSADNPWLNVDAKHDFNVFNDFNHESPYTKLHVARFIRHWMTEYKLDGFRWDLSKGFTQTNTLGNIGLWSSYDQSRVNIWKQYYDSMQAVSPGSYCILEHLGADAEESVLANYGMILWGKGTDDFKQNSMGYNTGNNLDRMYFKNRSGYNEPGLVSYAESHDEERINYNNLVNGNGNVKTLNTALARQEAMHTTLLAIPGPKMIWQFGELGYDYSINTCTDSATANPIATQISPNCRLAKKPIRWDYFTNINRKRIYNTISGMNNIRKTYPTLFEGATITSGTFLGNSLYKRVVAVNNDLSMVAIANYNVAGANENVTFPSTGKWYEYFSGDSMTVTSISMGIFLNPGAYKVYTNKKIANPLAGSNTVGINDVKANEFFEATIYPNPAIETSNIALSLKQDAELKVDIIDMTGKVIRNVFNGTLLSGNQELELLQLNTLPSGLYWVSLNANGIKTALPLHIQ
jgi:1,4-alpha-glucan branching enzyme